MSIIFTIISNIYFQLFTFHLLHDFSVSDIISLDAIYYRKECINFSKNSISAYIRKMMQQEDVTIKEAATYTGVSVGTFRNKLSQDRFSIGDLMILAEMCDYKLAFVPNHTINSLNTIEDKETSKSYILDILDEELQSKIEDYKIAKVDEMMSAMQAYIKTLSPEQIEKLFSHDNDDPKK